MRYYEKYPKMLEDALGVVRETDLPAEQRRLLLRGRANDDPQRQYTEAIEEIRSAKAIRAEYDVGTLKAQKEMLDYEIANLLSPEKNPLRRRLAELQTELADAVAGANDASMKLALLASIKDAKVRDADIPKYEAGTLTPTPQQEKYLSVKRTRDTFLSKRLALTEEILDVENQLKDQNEEVQMLRMKIIRLKHTIADTAGLAMLSDEQNAIIEKRTMEMDEITAYRALERSLPLNAQPKTDPIHFVSALRLIRRAYISYLANNKGRERFFRRFKNSNARAEYEALTALKTSFASITGAALETIDAFLSGDETAFADEIAKAKREDPNVLPAEDAPFYDPAHIDPQIFLEEKWAEISRVFPEELLSPEYAMSSAEFNVRVERALAHLSEIGDYIRENGDPGMPEMLEQIKKNTHATAEEIENAMLPKEQRRVFDREGGYMPESKVDANERAFRASHRDMFE